MLMMLKVVQSRSCPVVAEHPLVCRDLSGDEASTYVTAVAVVFRVKQPCLSGALREGRERRHGEA